MGRLIFGASRRRVLTGGNSAPRRVSLSLHFAAEPAHFAHWTCKVGRPVPAARITFLIHVPRMGLRANLRALAGAEGEGHWCPDTGIPHQYPHGLSG